MVNYPNYGDLCDEVRSFLDELCENYGLTEYLTTKRTSICGWARNPEAPIPSWLNCAAGMTRFVMWDNRNPKFVVKVQFSSSSINYNEGEASVYQEAVARGLQDCFAWACPIPYHTSEGWTTVYAMEYAEVDSDETEEESQDFHYLMYCDENDLDPSEDENYQEFCTHYSIDYCSDSEGMFDFIRSQWGGSLTDQVEDFLGQMNVNDTHAGNWGRRDGSYILIDYAGFGRKVGLEED